MKDHVYLLALTILLFSCRKEDKTNKVSPTVLSSITCKGSLITDNKICFTVQAEYARSYLWDFGDGKNSTESAPCHEYATAGRYTVRLVVNNDTAFTRRVELNVIAPPLYAELIGGVRTWRHTTGVSLANGITTTETQPDVSFAIVYIDPVSIAIGIDTLKYFSRYPHYDTVLMYTRSYTNSTGHSTHKTLSFTHSPAGIDSFMYSKWETVSAGGAAIEYFYCP